MQHGAVLSLLALVLVFIYGMLALASAQCILDNPSFEIGGMMRASVRLTLDK